MTWLTTWMSHVTPDLYPILGRAWYQQIGEKVTSFSSPPSSSCFYTHTSHSSSMYLAHIMCICMWYSILWCFNLLSARLYYMQTESTGFLSMFRAHCAQSALRKAVDLDHCLSGPWRTTYIRLGMLGLEHKPPS